jgi:hypothetical protein
MKKSMLFLAVFFMMTVAFAQTKTHYYPVNNSIISLKIPNNNWTVSNENTWMSFQPSETTNSGRLISMIWKSSDPAAEDAVSVLVEECFDLIETILVDIEWKEETTEFEINGIDFVGLDGWGDYVNEDGSRDEMMVSVSIFFPDDTNILAFVFFGLNEAYDKHGDELLEVMMSINSVK